MFRKAAFFVIVLAYGLSLAATQQMGCDTSFTDSQVAVLIGQNYLGLGQGVPPTITLQMSPEGFTFRVVCSSLSGIRNQYRFVSIVAYFTSSKPTSVSPGVPLYGQFEFECVNSVWSATSTLLDITLFDRTEYTTAAFSAVNATITTSCAYCLKPSSTSRSERVSDTVNHCSACTGCSQPLCYTPDTTIPSSGTFISQTCCNYYSSDGVTCITACPLLSFPDANRTCIPCTLTCQNGGTLRTDMCGCNCTAVTTGSNCSTCLCKNGGTCTASGTCSCPTGYSGQLCDACNRTCPTGNYLNSSTCSCVPCTLTCQNGGTLQTNAGTFCTCSCPPQFMGMQCESAIPSPSPSIAATSTPVTTRAVTTGVQTTPISSRAAVMSSLSSSPISSSMTLKPTPVICRETTTRSHTHHHHHHHHHHTHPTSRTHNGNRMRKHPSGSKKASAPCLPRTKQTKSIGPRLVPRKLGPRSRPAPGKLGPKPRPAPGKLGPMPRPAPGPMPRPYKLG